MLGWSAVKSWSRTKKRTLANATTKLNLCFIRLMIKRLAQPSLKMSNGFYTYMKDLGVCVDEFSLKQAIANNHKIWHLHWPELPLNNRNFLKAFIKAQALLLQLDWARSRGTKTIWTVHNLAAHEKFYPQLEAWFWKAFIRRLDGYISLSNAGMEAAQRFPALKNLPGFVIPHGHYRGEFDTLSAEAFDCPSAWLRSRAHAEVDWDS